MRTHYRGTECNVVRADKDGIVVDLPEKDCHGHVSRNVIPLQTINDWVPEVRSAISTIRRHGFRLIKANNGEYSLKCTKDNLTATVENLIACDEAWLTCEKDGKRATFYLVLGNSPGELIADVGYARELEIAVDAIIDEHSTRWEPRKQPTKQGFYGYDDNDKFRFIEVK